MTEIKPISADAYPQLEQLGGSATDRSGLVEALRAIMDNFVDRAFGVDSVELAEPTRTAELQTTGPIRPRRRVLARPTRRSRRQAIPNVAAKRSAKRRMGSCRT